MDRLQKPKSPNEALWVVSTVEYGKPYECVSYNDYKNLYNLFATYGQHLPGCHYQCTEKECLGEITRSCPLDCTCNFSQVEVRKP